MEKSKIEFRQRRDLGEVISTTMQFIIQNFLHLNGYLLMLAAPFILIGLMIAKLIPTDWEIILDRAPLEILGYMLSSLGLFFLFFVVLTTVLYRYLSLYERKGAKAFNLEELLGESLKALPNVLGTFVGIGLLTLLTIIAMGILVGGLGSVFGQAGFLVSVLLLLLLLIPVVYVSIHLFFIFIIRLEERMSFVKGIKRSFYLLKGYFWESFGVLIVCSLIQAAISYAVLIPLGIFGFTGDLFDITNSNPEASSNALLIYYGINFGLNIFTSIIPILATSLQYYNLVEHKESKGLAAQIETIGTNKDASSDEEQY